MGGHEMRKHLLRRYVVFRVKAIEYLDIGALRQGLKNGEFCPRTPVGRTPSDFAESLRTVQLSWFAVFIDRSKDGMDVMKLWQDLFPGHKADIEAAWRRMEPGWEVIRTFRDKAGFHADKPIQFFSARADIVNRRKLVEVSLKEFEQLFRLTLKDEPTEIPELEDVVDDLLSELEEKLQCRYRRDEFKRYMMLPNARSKPSA